MLAAIGMTGDLITGGYRFAHRVATILSHLHAKTGVICTFGNHDYSVYGKTFSKEGKRRADHLEQSLIHHGLIVLRNVRPGSGAVGQARPAAAVAAEAEDT